MLLMSRRGEAKCQRRKGVITKKNRRWGGSGRERGRGIDHSRVQYHGAYGDGENVRRGRRVDGGSLLELEATGIQMQEYEPGGTTLDYSCNGFNELIRLETLWIVQHRCPEGERFTFNYYNHWAHLILCLLGIPSTTLISREGADDSIYSR